MGFRKNLRNFIVGKDDYIAARAEYKTAMLRGQLCIAFILVCISYIAVDTYHSIFDFIIYYFSGILTCMVGFWLNRSAKYLASNFVLLSFGNALVYVFASTELYKAGTSIYFIIASLVALSLFSFEKRWIALLFCGLSLSLFIMIYFFKIAIVPISPAKSTFMYSEGYVQASFISNFLISFLICCAIFYFLLDINHYSEKEIVKKNELLSKTNQELDRFVYSASHDLKAPLSSISGLIEIAQRTDDKDEIIICLGLMKERIHNLDEFIKEIIDYSRNSRTHIRKENFNLISLAKEVVDDLRYAEGYENIYVTYKIDERIEVLSDRSRLKIVLNNLVGNSFKYHDPNKQNPLIEISSAIVGNSLKLEIQDNGLGIEPKHQTKIFDMFYRASEKSKGSGLGLYIVKETIEKLGGEIFVESQLSIGTKFTLKLSLY
jgi:signal transduction histidine kinase